MCYPPGRSVFTWVCSNIKVHIACKGKDATVNAVDAFLLRRDGCTVNWEIYIQDWARHQGLFWRYGARAWFKSVSRAKGHLISASTHTVQSTCVQCMLLICLETLSVSWQSNWEIMNSVTRNLQWGWKWASRRKKEENMMTMTMMRQWCAGVVLDQVCGIAFATEDIVVEIRIPRSHAIFGMWGPSQERRYPLDAATFPNLEISGLRPEMR